MASKIFIAFALLAGISSSVKATVHDAETIPSEQVVTNTGCTPAAFSDIWALRSVLNRKMRLGPRGFSLNMPDGTCLYASIDEITLVRDHPNVLAMHKSVMQQNADEIAQNALLGLNYNLFCPKRYDGTCSAGRRRTKPYLHF